MKNVINYYYNLYPTDIHYRAKKFYFDINDQEYILMPFFINEEKINKINNIISLLDYNHITYNNIQKNVTNNIVTYVSDIPYILIKINIKDKENIILNDLILFNKKTSNLLNEVLDIQRLHNMWSNKIDYFEYQVNQFGIKFPIIRHSFNYFVGLSENAITLLNNIKNSKIKTTIMHFRISPKQKITDLYNPLSFVIDSKIRDISEFIKEKMFFCNVIDEVIYFFNYNQFTLDEIILFLSRIMYTTYYFDECEKAIEENDETYIKVLVSKISNYENNIKKIYKYLLAKYNLPEINWLLV